MRPLLCILLCIGSLMLKAQPNDWQTWYFGLRLGMTYTSGSRVLLSDSKLGANYGAACISYPSDGRYMMVTNGTVIYSKGFQLMNKQLSVPQPIFSFFVPDPAAELNYYLFVVDNQGTIHYIHIDHSDPSGIGTVDGTQQTLRSNADHHFTAVKRIYGDGYWLITHTKGSDEFQAFAITKNGVSTQPVISNTGSSTSSLKNWVYGNMVSDKSGKRLLHCFSRGGSGNVAELLNIDKQCGTLSHSQNLEISGSDRGCQGAFSLNDRFVYVSSGGVYQYDLNETTPIIKGNYLLASGGASPKIALTPDGIIMMSRADGSSVTSKVCTIEQANTANPQYFYDKVNLNDQGDYRYVENFPAFIMDWSDPLQDPNYPLPEVSIEQLCTGNPTRFDVKGTFQYDSLLWEFGDGITADTRQSNHEYLLAASYTVTFNWYLCGQRYSIAKTITVNEYPQFSLGPDTLLCFGTVWNLEGPANADAYTWNTGESTRNLEVEEQGLYWLDVFNGTCSSRDSILINYRPDVLVELGTGHHLCPDDSGLVRLDAGKGFETYRWTPTGDTTQWIDVRKTGEYFVVVNDFHGCPGKDGTYVERRCPVFLELPNAFSPNGDGINDLLIIPSSDALEYRLRIYNRWGQLVFQSDKPEQSWDGKYKGKPVQEDVYVMVLNYKGYVDGILRNFSRRETLHLIR